MTCIRTLLRAAVDPVGCLSRRPGVCSPAAERGINLSGPLLHLGMPLGFSTVLRTTVRMFLWTVLAAPRDVPRLQRVSGRTCSAVQRRVPLPVGDDVAVTDPLLMLELGVAGDQLLAEARARHNASLEGADRIEQVERQALELRVVVAVRVHVA